MFVAEQNRRDVEKKLRVTSWVGPVVACFGEKEGKIMRSMTRFIVAVSFFAFAGIGLSAVQAEDQKQTTGEKQTTDQKQSQGQDQWRYTFRNGEWWYWL